VDDVVVVERVEDPEAIAGEGAAAAEAEAKDGGGGSQTLGQVAAHGTMKEVAIV
jgi:hypothetical protein